jgi:hypothetical protein
MVVHDRMTNLLSAAFPDKPVVQKFDRLCHRRKGASFSAESFHQDSGPETTLGPDADAFVIQGWINLDPPGSAPQIFQCVRGTQEHRVPGSRGFAPIPEALAKQRGYEAETVEVPSGHWIAFRQTIVHCVAKKVYRQDSWRLFVAFGVGKDVVPVDPSIFDEQAVPPLPGGERPKTYALLHWTNHRKKLSEWSKRLFVPQCLEDKTVGSGADKGTTYNVVRREMPSLRELGLPMYAAYLPAEKIMFGALC